MQSAPTDLTLTPQLPRVHKALANGFVTIFNEFVHICTTAHVLGIHKESNTLSQLVSKQSIFEHAELKQEQTQAGNRFGDDCFCLMAFTDSNLTCTRYSTALTGGDGEDKPNLFPLSNHVWMNDSTAISVIRWLLNGLSQLLSMAWWKEWTLTVISCFPRNWDFRTREDFFCGQKTFYQLNIVLH